MIKDTELKYSVKMVYGSTHSPTPDHLWDFGDVPSEPTQWCIDNAGMRKYDWNRYHYCGLMFYYFKREDTAMLFKLTWANYLCI